MLELYSRDTGKREAKLAFDVGQGTQDLGFRNELNVLFDCEPARGSGARHPGRRRHAHHRAVRVPRFAGPRLSFAQPPPGPGLVLPRPDLSAQRRERHAAAGQVQRDLHARAGVSHSRPRDDRAAGRLAQGVVPAEALDQAGRSSAGTRATITFTRPAAPITIRRPKACSRST